MPNSDSLPVNWRSRRLLHCGLATCVTAATLLAWPPIIAWQQRRFADQLARRAVHSTAGDLGSIRRLVQLGAAATDSLMRLACLQRPEIAAEAQNALADQLAAWEIEFAEQGDSAAYAEQLAAISSALRQHTSEFDAAGRHWAQKLARRIVFDCDPLNAQQAWPVLADCDVVLSAPSGKPMPDRPLLAMHQPPAAQVEPPSAPTTPLSRGPASLPDSRSEIDDAFDGDSDASFSELAVIMPSTQPTPSGSKVDASTGAQPFDNPLRETYEGRELPTPTAIWDSSAPAVDVPSPVDMRHAKQRLRELSDQELINLSETASRFEAAAARQALRGRGYSDAMLGMTREIRRLPTRERKQALDRVDLLPPSDARRLLRWFVTDEDADVRLHALTLLATAGDPQLVEIARRRAIDDADPRVAALAAKLLQQR